ncbi:hypothetical protein [Nesterenkonia sp. CF4.4]|uniref:hypothetical protein n=1 Tax=Nesterenkonia sp. CF4.4 TaxID=3373079 RepID=UPI003EE64781
MAAGALVLGLAASGFMAGLRAGRRRHLSSSPGLFSWAVAATLIIAGLAVVILAMDRPTSFGWFAYAPLSDTTYMPGPSGATLAIAAAGVALLVLGLLATGFLAGVRIRRSGHPLSHRQDRGNPETK